MRDLFVNQVLKAIFFGHGEAVMRNPQHRANVERAYYIARAQLKTANEYALYPRVIRYVRGFYHELSHWC